MAAYYFDTSALVKRYMREVGTSWVLELTNSDLDHDIYIVRITGPEMVAALVRKARTGEETREDVFRGIENFKNDFGGQYHHLDVTDEVVSRAMTLAQQYNLRGYDSVQLATAVELQIRRNREGFGPFTFLSADNDLNHAAESEGLQVDNPNAHA